MNVLRTPDERFKNLLDYPFSPNYTKCENVRIHYIDEGESVEEVILLIHGEPSWSYLYRKMIPILSDNGYRVIAPDLVGFGKSDKLINQEDYTYKKHVDWITIFIEKLELLLMKQMGLEEENNVFISQIKHDKKGKYEPNLSVKVPFQYNKFQTDIYSDHSSFVSLLNIQSFTMMKCDIYLDKLWKINDTFHCKWKCKAIHLV